MSKIANPRLAAQGERNYSWAKNHMPGLTSLAEKHVRAKSLEGLKVGVCLHVTKETSVLVEALTGAGATVMLAAANPLSTQDDIAAFLTRHADVWAWRGESAKEYAWAIGQVLARGPDFIIDDGADLHVAAHQGNVRLKGGCEETTTGVMRLKALEKEGRLAYPVIAVNNSRTKYLFDNRYGTGQSTFDGILRATSLLIAGKKVVIVGYGWVGKGIAKRARGLDANVTVVEVDPVKALEAHLDGFNVGSMVTAAREGDLFITATGQKKVIPYSAIEEMRDGAILANAGHFDVEIDVESLESHAKSVREVRPHVDEFRMQNGRLVYLLAKGRIVNLVAAEGHPPEVMQMSFANQFMATVYLSKNHRRMQNAVHDVPREIEEGVARATLDSLGISIDRPTREQREYADSWLL